MAVFTNISKEEIERYIKNYSIGNLISFEGIVEGIENTNYKITTDKNKYILTIFEKRVCPEDLPFFMNLQKELVAKGFNCPFPIKNNNNSIINNLKNKNAVIISYLEGKKVTKKLPQHCHEVGSVISQFTNITKLLKLSRPNSMGYEAWVNITEKCKKINDLSYKEYFKILDEELLFIKKNWPINLPKAIIHADLFKDNIFFTDNKISGVIDFYFSCNDFIAYELALAINAWCFDESGKFNLENYKLLLIGFKSNAKLNKEEKNSMNTLLRGAAVRILVTRLHDKIFHPNDALVIPKDPKEYLNILRWHQNNTNIEI
jgi:homoserine kinase type II